MLRSLIRSSDWNSTKSNVQAEFRLCIICHATLLVGPLAAPLVPRLLRVARVLAQRLASVGVVGVLVGVAPKRDDVVDLERTARMPA